MEINHPSSTNVVVNSVKNRYRYVCRIRYRNVPYWKSLVGDRIKKIGIRQQTFIFLCQVNEGRYPRKDQGIDL